MKIQFTLISKILFLFFVFNFTNSIAYQTPTDSINKIIFQGGFGSGFGNQVVSGDFNGDGIDDIAVTSIKPGETCLLHISIFYGSSSFDTVADLIILADTVYEYPRDYSITNAGDINDDGYDDLIVSSYQFNNNTGRVLIFLGGNPMDAEYDFVINGYNNYSGYGTSVSSAGDINGDGVSDFLVASSINYNLQIDTSKVFLYFGDSNFDVTPDLIFYSPYLDDSFGSSIASAGDINNDGFDDILIGYKGFNDKIYIYLGAEIVEDSFAFILQNNQVQSNFGSSMCGGNDFNLDGYDDIVIGAPRFDPLGGGAQKGRVYVYLGGQDFNTVADLVLNGTEQLEQFGQSISGAGFFNEDNYPDLIINSPFSNNFNGSAYIYFGSSEFDGNADITMYGDYTDQFTFGGTITNCDFNNDGLSELLFSNRVIGMPGLQNSLLLPDRVYLYYYVLPPYKIQYEATNFIYEEPNSFTFDVYVKNNGLYPWQYRNGSLTFSFNSSILRNGSLLWSIVPGYSDFPLQQQPQNAIVYNSSSIGTEGTIPFEGYLFNPGEELRYSRFRIQTTDSNFAIQPHYLRFVKTGLNKTVSSRWVWYNGDGRLFNNENISFLDLQYELLPVELTLFTATINQTKINLNWQTATEMNNNGFEIQRKLKNSDWVTLGFKRGKGTTTEPTDYFFEDDISEINSNKFYYRLRQIDFNGEYKFSEEVEVITLPLNYNLSQNYPNPFNPITKIKYEIPENSFVRLEIFDLLGRQLKSLVNEMKSAGKYEVEFNASDLPVGRQGLSSGLYLYKITAEKFEKTMKMLLLK